MCGGDTRRRFTRAYPSVTYHDWRAWSSRSRFSPQRSSRFVPSVAPNEPADLVLRRFRLPCRRRERQPPVLRRSRRLELRGTNVAVERAVEADAKGHVGGETGQLGPALPQDLARGGVDTE